LTVVSVIVSLDGQVKEFAKTMPKSTISVVSKQDDWNLVAHYVLAVADKLEAFPEKDSIAPYKKYSDSHFTIIITLYFLMVHPS